MELLWLLLLLQLLPTPALVPALAPLLPLLGRACTIGSLRCSVGGTDAPSGPTVTISSGSTGVPVHVLLWRRIDGPRSSTRWQKLSSSSTSSSARHALLVDACSRLRPLASCLSPEKLPPLVAAAAPLPSMLLRTPQPPPLLARSTPAVLPALLAACGAAPAELGLLLLVRLLSSKDALTAAMAAGSLSLIRADSVRASCAAACRLSRHAHMSANSSSSSAAPAAAVLLSALLLLLCCCCCCCCCC
jgi:hypothetical protein